MEPENETSLPEIGMGEAKEYVRQQLQSMRIRHVSEEELEAYTKEFLEVIRERSGSSEASPLSDASSVVSSGNSTHDYPCSSQKQYRPRDAHYSAVYKSFPGEGPQCRQLNLPPSATPTPPHPCSATPTRKSPDTDTSVSLERNSFVKRKVLRKHAGESVVMDESIDNSTSGNSCEQESDRRPHSAITSRGPAHHQKSFIRPPTSHPHTRNFHKCDPVNRYHEFREMWEACKAPGEKARYDLRWHVRDQLMYQDLPLYQPKQHLPQQGNYVVPTAKKRQALRWQIRHELARQMQ